MKIQHLLIALTVVNIVLLAFSLAQSRTVAAQGVTPELRGRALEIVDDHGRVRVLRCFQQLRKRMARFPMKLCYSG
jgi:hypothetical protein